MRSAGAWLAAGLAALALAIGVVALYASQTLFSADGFAARVDATLQADAVRADVARRLSDAAIAAQPDLVAVRPLVRSAADGLVGTEAFRSLVRGAARDVHRSAFDASAGTVTLTVRDAGVLLVEALRHLRPDLAERLPDDLAVRLGAASGAALELAEVAERVRTLAVLACLVAVLLALGALWLSPSRREGATRLGVCVVVADGGLLVAVSLTPWIAAGSAAGRAALGVWLDPLRVWAVALCGAGLVVTFATSSAARPVTVLPVLRRAVRAASEPRWRVPRDVAALAVGAALIVWPLTVVRIAAVSAGLVLVLAGATELLTLAGPPPERAVSAGGRQRLRRAGIAGALLVLLAGGAALAAGGSPAPRLSGRCNGHAELCDRPLNDVAFLGTHNSMAADNEPGWLFAAQDAGIGPQLSDGVRALLIDTHYGFATPRGVATDLSGESTSREKVVEEVGERFVETAERLRERIGYDGGGTREIFLCHTFCEVGATRALDALEGVQRFLVAHPEEVLILSIQDDTTAADTAKLIRDSGLIREVYRGAARPPWPTLRALIDRDERVLVLVENHPGAEPWLYPQFEVSQETPFHFNTAQELAAPDSCRVNRGGTTGSLLLVNHWVDTSPAPRASIAREVNARAFIDERLNRCRQERGLLPTIAAVDFYRQGDAFGAVDRLNGLTPAG
jgi:hypothetical protein